MASGALKSTGVKSDLVLRSTTLVYLGLMVVLPLAALTAESARPGAAAFLEALRDPYALALSQTDVYHGTRDGICECVDRNGDGVGLGPI